MRGAVPRAQRGNSISKAECVELGKTEKIEYWTLERRRRIVPHRASAYGADPELMVSAGGPESAEVHGHPERKVADFRKRDGAGVSRRRGRLAPARYGDRVGFVYTWARAVTKVIREHHFAQENRGGSDPVASRPAVCWSVSREKLQSVRRESAMWRPSTAAQCSWRPGAVFWLL